MPRIGCRTSDCSRTRLHRTSRPRIRYRRDTSRPSFAGAGNQDVRRQIGAPALTLGCDCILRRLEIVQSGLNERVSELMIENNVVGFATYGEQFNGMHVNQTFTGVALGSAPRAAQR